LNIFSRWMFDGNRDNQIFRKIVKFWLAIVRENNGKNIKVSSFAFPAKTLTKL